MSRVINPCERNSSCVSKTRDERDQKSGTCLTNVISMKSILFRGFIYFIKCVLTLPTGMQSTKCVIISVTCRNFTNSKFAGLNIKSRYYSPANFEFVKLRHVTEIIMHFVDCIAVGDDKIRCIK